MRWAPSHGAGAWTLLVRWAKAFAHGGPLDPVVAGSPLHSSLCGGATYPCGACGEMRTAAAADLSMRITPHREAATSRSEAAGPYRHANVLPAERVT